MGGASTTSQALIQSAGGGFRLRAAVLHEEFARGGAFQTLLLRYTQALLTQIAQTAVCNRLHSIEQRLCRWLLLTQDRVPPGEVRMTHEFIGQMLAVRRESITLVALRLQAAGVISYTQRHITIVDREGLEGVCVSVIKWCRTSLSVCWEVSGRRERPGESAPERTSY